MAEKLAAKSYARIPDIYALPNLIEVQLNSFNWFIEEFAQPLFNKPVERIELDFDQIRQCVDVGDTGI